MSGRKGGRDVQISKTMSWALRHGIEKLGVKMGSDGFVDVEELLSKPEFRDRSITEEDVRRVVDADEKSRYSLVEVDGRPRIRANQGHSIKNAIEDSEMMTPIRSEDCEGIPECVHGTYRKSWDVIAQGGLNVMSRRHIHFAPGLPGQGGVISGMRQSAQLYVYIDLPRAVRDGVPFFRSANNVILSPGINGVLSPAYFSKVIDSKTGQNIWDPTQTSTPSQPGCQPGEEGGSRTVSTGGGATHSKKKVYKPQR